MTTAAAGDWAQMLIAVALSAYALARVFAWIRGKRNGNGTHVVCPVDAAPQLTEIVRLNRDSLVELRQLVAETREGRADHREMLVYLRRD